MSEPLAQKWVREYDEEQGTLHGCGYEIDSFACKIRHISINTGDAKASKD